MKKQGFLAAFCFEAVLLAAILLAVVLILTGTFSRARAAAEKASLVTEASILAENAAEAVTAGNGDPDRICAALAPDGSAAPDIIKETGTSEITAFYRKDGEPDASGILKVTLTLTEEKDRMVYGTVSVLSVLSGEELLRLETAVCVREEDSDG